MYSACLAWMGAWREGSDVMKGHRVFPRKGGHKVHQASLFCLKSHSICHSSEVEPHVWGWGWVFGSEHRFVHFYMPNSTRLHFFCFTLLLSIMIRTPNSSSLNMLWGLPAATRIYFPQHKNVLLNPTIYQHTQVHTPPHLLYSLHTYTRTYRPREIPVEWPQSVRSLVFIKGWLMARASHDGEGWSRAPHPGTDASSTLSRDVTSGAPITSASLFQTTVQNNDTVAIQQKAIMGSCVFFQSLNISFLLPQRDVLLHCCAV